MHAVLANNLYVEHARGIVVSQRYETHTIALAYRRGLKIGRVPPFELGAQVQLNRRNDGVLNGFIAGVEDFWAALANQPSAKNELRESDATLPPLGLSIHKNGKLLHRGEGRVSGVGDVYLIAKAALLDGSPAAKTSLAFRVAANIAGRSEFTQGNFIGIGLSVDRKLLEWVAFHGDVRATAILDRDSMWNLPLRRTSFGFSVGPEFKLTRNLSFNLQIDGSSTPYQLTGAEVFDRAYGDIAVGLGYRFSAAGRAVVAQLYGRENMNLPFRVEPNADPDFSTGLKISIR